MNFQPTKGTKKEAEDYINKLILKLTSLDKDNNYKFDKMLVVRKISPLDTEI